MCCDPWFYRGNGASRDNVSLKSLNNTWSPKLHAWCLHYLRICNWFSYYISISLCLLIKLWHNSDVRFIHKCYSRQRNFRCWLLSGCHFLYVVSWFYCKQCQPDCKEGMAWKNCLELAWNAYWEKITKSLKRGLIYRA